MRQYWWGVENRKKKMSWVAWERLTLPKSQGGIGFRDMRAYNQALLAKQAWRLLTNPESLCARLLRAKYYPNGNLVDTVFPSNSSAVWKGIEHGPELVKKGILWRVGNGASIRTWRDPWIPRAWSRQVITLKGQNVLTHVSELICPVTGTWDAQLGARFILAR